MQTFASRSKFLRWAESVSNDDYIHIGYDIRLQSIIVESTSKTETSPPWAFKIIAKRAMSNPGHVWDSICDLYTAVGLAATRSDHRLYVITTIGHWLTIDSNYMPLSKALFIEIPVDEVLVSVGASRTEMENEFFEIGFSARVVRA